MGTFITEFFRSASSMLSGPRSFVNEMVLFIRKMLPSFSLDMRIIAPPCFICSASEGLEVGCSAPGCSAGCHPLCLRQQLRLSSVLSYLHANTLFCPLHHSQSLRAMKCPLKQASRVSCTYGVSTCCICGASYYSIYSASSRSICSTSSYSVRNASYYGIHDSASLSFHDTSLLHVDGSSHVRSRSNLSSLPLLHAPLLHSQATAKTVFRLDHTAEAVSGQSSRRRKLSEERR